MYIKALAASLFFFSTGILASLDASEPCSQDDRRCFWYGVSPNCGRTWYNIGDIHGDKELIITSQNKSARELYDDGKITEDCYGKYGVGCVAGYKRLWCVVEEF
jgi:hypothetical protein